MLGQTEPDSGWLGWLFGAIGTLATAVAFLFKRLDAQRCEQIDQHETAIKGLTERAEACEKDRGQLRVELAEVRTRLDMREK